MNKKPKISLAVIAGNVENHIGRFLDHFQSVADEVIVVRAIGNQEEDGTLDIAGKRGCVTGEYFNKKHWPHVDDFAAARNLACDMATGDWLMWADTDDIITPDSVAQIRRLIEDIHDKPVDGVLMRYVVPEDGVINWRERLWRKGKARWQNPIHECLLFNEDSQSIRFDGAEIVHASEKRSAKRDERNLRILESIPEADRTISQRFHVFQSLIALDRNIEAIPKAMEFAQLPDAGKNERYEALFQLARLATDPSDKKAILLQALSTDPNRREAYGELALACMPDESEKSLGYTEAMMALRLPSYEEAPWNLRRPYYGQLGVSLRAMALRVNQRREEADALETNHFLRNGAKISLLHATRGRPGMAWRTRMDWLRMASNPDAIEHIYAIDATDHESFLLTNARCVVVNGNGGCVAAWNAAAAASKGQVLVQLSDDFAPFQGWDEAILSAIGDTSRQSVLAVSDGHRTDNLLCMAILTRKRYEAQGYLFHPEFFSMFSDNWFTDQAYRDDVVINARGSITFEHLHPAFDKGEMDQTYARSNSAYNYQAGAGIMRRLQEGVKVSAEMGGWFDFRDTYDMLAQHLQDGDSFMEVGTWKGQSLTYLTQRIQDLGKTVYLSCVDTFKGDADTGKIDVYDECLSNFRNAEVNASITMICQESVEAATYSDNGYFAAIFLDAAHDYESVMADIAAWKPKLKVGGIFAGHDIDSPDVRRALEDSGIEFAKMGRCWISKP